ncbi:MAG: Fis family transcriptional regulator [Deltaproteobacteria bacterium RBG_13_65_10]|nr:MAG: Fis family transcriptional regulator [Deltaproteobacteria bacterium RBG_13_65_10]
MTPKILVVDDEESIRRTLSAVLRDEGYPVVLAADGDEALGRTAQEQPDLVLLDIAMPGKGGIEVLERLREEMPWLPVIMMSGHGTVETAVKATKLGAYDFIEKPLSIDKLLVAIRNATDLLHLVDVNRILIDQLDSRAQIVGESEPMRKLKSQIETVAPTNASVLITGENGTGKEVVARAIHALSLRHDKPFVEVNCAAIPEELIESELFGHEKGAFTGALAQKRGKFDLANQGTLFLDEIGDMSLKTQAKVLRILQERTFERVGGVKKIEVDVRVLAATNKDLEVEIAKGTFREDLFYRLNVIPFRVPPLRERLADIPALVDHFLGRSLAETGRGPKQIDKGVFAVFTAYAWPGNVRELRNMMERLVLMTPGLRIAVEDLPEEIRRPGKHAALPLPDVDSLAEARARFEREFIAQKLAENGGNISKTAEKLGVARESLSRKIKQFGLQIRADAS